MRKARRIHPAERGGRKFCQGCWSGLILLGRGARRCGCKSGVSYCLAPPTPLQGEGIGCILG